MAIHLYLQFAWTNIGNKVLIRNFNFFCLKAESVKRKNFNILDIFKYIYIA